MATYKKWYPRSSSLGGYMLCNYRAALDRLVWEGAIEIGPPSESAGYAELGTLIHDRLQTSLRCTMPPDYKGPTAEETAAALKVAGTPENLERMVDACAALARQNMPKAPGPGPWLSEMPFRRKGLTGHIDFLSEDRTVIVDLKTTARKPDHNRMKGEHFVQLCAYKILVPTVRAAHILYVDSLKAQWALLVTADMTTPEMTEYLLMLEEQVKAMRSKAYIKRVIPHIGSHCSSSFCPHTSICRDKLLPPSGTVWERTAQTIKTQEVL